MTASSGDLPADILIVEDSRTQAEQLRWMLEQNQLKTEVAPDGVQALTMLKRRKPALVISDINMPEMDGYELCRQIRADPALSDLPVILLTSLSDPEDIVRGLDSGADNFVIKPPDEGYLLSRIRYIMANRHLRASEGTRFAIEFELGGRKHRINADRLQMLHLLLSTYDSAIQRGRQLAATQEELRRANENLEANVRERTIALTNEIAEKTRLHEQLQRSEENYRQLFASNPLPMWVFDAGTLRFLAVNDAAVAHYGYSRDEFLGMTIADIRPPSEKSALQEHLEHPRPNLDKGLWIHRKKNGERIIVEVTAHDLTFEGRAARLILAQDITQQKALEAQLQRTQRVESVGRLASGIAHDLNNVLAPIMMSVSLLRSDVPPEQADKLLSAIEASAQRGATLVRRLLIFGRGVEGERRPLDVAAIIGEVLDISKRTFPKNITFHTSFANDIGRVHGDATQLHQIILNLCVNARDAMAAGGTLTISAKDVEIDEHYAAQHPDAKPGRFILIRVADTGTGIPPEIVDRIFDPFFTTKKVGEGTGLGLATVLGIIKSHAGFLQLDSEVGRGTTFDIYLPASERAGEKEPAIAQAAAEAPPGRGELILVVDDEERIRGVVRDTLVRHNYRVLLARDGVEAIAICAAEPDIKVLLTDLDMPLMNGIELGLVLKRMNQSIEVIVSSGSEGRVSVNGNRAHLKTLGTKAILVKPYTADTLLRAMHTTLAHASAGEAAPR